ncbi:17781_t:CDS:10 [Rhizophagus irregularis]|nr:17781_t:CDS:10 [Rhizophagus irregularis]
METAYPPLNELFVFLNTTITQISIFYSHIPGSGILLKYIKNSHQNDPFRTILELLLVFFAIIYLFTKKYRTDNLIELTPQEVEELVDEWQPEPLVPQLSDEENEFDKIPVINGPQGPRVKLVNGKPLLNISSFDFLGLLSHDSIKEKAIKTLREYGVGSCGPPGFYGTVDVHTEIERKISDFLGTEDTIIYSQGFSTINSAIPSFCKRGDIIVADEGCNFSIQKGLQISRSIIKWYKHNNMEDLERVLRKIKDEDIETGRRLTRRFIVSEGLFENYGDITPLPNLKKFKYRLILDESLSFGTLGKRGAGLTDYFDIDPNQVDMIVGSMCYSIASSGGFCSGSFEITEHQRISGPAYSDSPVIHLRIDEGIVRVGDIEDKEKCLQDIVDEAMNNGVLLTRAKYNRTQELFSIEPSIRICISASFNKKEIEKTASVIKSAATKVLKNRVH